MIVVTGMHRSGTSAVAQVLSSLGADFGDENILIPKDRWNERGYLESKPIVDLNNRMILGGNADLEKRWLTATENRLARAYNGVLGGKWKYYLLRNLDSVLRRAQSLQGEMLGLHETYSELYVKDPRFSLTISAWASLGPVDRVLFSFRHPLAVAQSLKARDKLPIFQGLRQWEMHVQSFLTTLPNHVPLTLVNYDNFFDADLCQQEMARLSEFSGTAPHPDVGSGLIDPGLRHELPRNRRLPKKVDTAYQRLCQLHAA